MATGSFQIGEWLGVAPPQTNTAVLELVQSRLETTAIQRLLDLGFERAEIADLILPLRTLQHRRSRGERLTVEESDKVLGVLRILSMTEEVYGSRERAFGWLRRPNPRLDGSTPMSLLQTNVGNRMVEELLGQISEGMFI